MLLYGGSLNRTVSTRSSCSTVNVSNSRSRAWGAISRRRSRVLHGGALHAEVDRSVIGRHGGLDDVAVPQIFRVLGLAGEEGLPLQLVGKQRPDHLDWLGRCADCRADRGTGQYQIAGIETLKSRQRLHCLRGWVDDVAVDVHVLAHITVHPQPQPKRTEA